LVQKKLVLDFTIRKHILRFCGHTGHQEDGDHRNDGDDHYLFHVLLLLQAYITVPLKLLNFHLPGFFTLPISIEFFLAIHKQMKINLEIRF